MSSAYTDEQIDNYLEYTKIPTQYRRSANPERNLDFLTALHVHHISTFPYENLSLHYSENHEIIIDPQFLYKKLTANGRGGYCMESSTLMNHVLRGLGFQVYTTGVRIRRRVDGVPSGKYIGWVHIVNLVTLEDGIKYMVDVAFGGDGAIKPIPLIDGHTIQNIGSQQIRLVYDNIPEQTDKSMKLWIYQYRNDPSFAWNSFYCFSEIEFLHPDFELMSFFTSSSPTSPQTYTMLVVKFLRKDNEIYGKLMLVNGDVKQNTGGKTVLIKTCKTEEERVEVLKTLFGITLTEGERSGITGTAVELIEKTA